MYGEEHAGRSFEDKDIFRDRQKGSLHKINGTAGKGGTATMLQSEMLIFATNSYVEIPAPKRRVSLGGDRAKEGGAPQRGLSVKPAIRFSSDTRFADTSS